LGLSPTESIDVENLVLTVDLKLVLARFVFAFLVDEWDNLKRSGGRHDEKR